MYQEERLQDPVLAWADIQSDPARRRRYQQARGKGGLVRAGWDEAVEIIAAAHVHTIRTYGPDRIAGFSPIAAMAMAMVSHAAGARFMGIIGAQTWDRVDSRRSLRRPGCLPGARRRVRQ